MQETGKLCSFGPPQAQPRPRELALSVTQRIAERQISPD